MGVGTDCGLVLIENTEVMWSKIGFKYLFQWLFPDLYELWINTKQFETQEDDEHTWELVNVTSVI